ncbi:hypothetical protein QGM71_17105 [Virgibacillus sp. C22-A2]|uniref:Uncharacterized protein n=1 Tax=Virgibacillus tibetensis TaxID=3042313 RepID=A0ABU6KJC8_9BACI|nr:hypothetical protein [Virgibacillus sp. C22-A2]
MKIIIVGSSVVDIVQPVVEFVVTAVLRFVHAGPLIVVYPC